MIVHNLEIYEKIGQGEFATVYKGRHKSQAELVAIKAIPLQKFIVNPPLRKMIDAEEKALRLATHEHIIKLFQVFQTDKEIDLIYEFCDGGSLGDLMKRHLFSEPEALKILHDVAQALQALKVHNIVHRDIKPENIFVKQGCVKLGDFGLCMIGEPTNQDSFTHIGSFIFMAPESLTQFLYTFKSDVYSLGIMIYEILSGKMPFTTKNVIDLVEQKRQFTISRATLPHVSNELISILERMTRFEPDERVSIDQIIFETSRLMKNLSIPKSLTIRDPAKDKVKVPMVNHSRFQKKPIDPSFEVIDNAQKFLFNKRLNECKVRCLLELNHCNGNKQYTMPCVFLAKNILETNNKLIVFSRNLQNAAFEQQELESVKRTVESINNAVRSNFTLPRYAGESCRTTVDGNEILDILLSKGAFDLKYETDDLVANPQNSIEELKKRLITGVLLMNLIDQEALGFNLDINQPFEAQRMLLDITRQSFLWLHQKLTSMIEPYEVIANIDIDVHLYNRHLPVVSKSTLHDEMRKSNIYASPGNHLANTASPQQHSSNSHLSPKTSAFGRSLSSSLTPAKLLPLPAISEAPELETGQKANFPSSASRNNMSTKVIQQQKTMPLTVAGGSSLSYKTLESSTRPNHLLQPTHNSQSFGQPIQLSQSAYTGQGQMHPQTTLSSSGQFAPLTALPGQQNTTLKYFSK